MLPYGLAGVAWSSSRITALDPPSDELSYPEDGRIISLMNIALRFVGLDIFKNQSYVDYCWTLNGPKIDIETL